MVLSSKFVTIKSNKESLLKSAIAKQDGFEPTS